MTCYVVRVAQPVARPVPTANWSRVQNGKITSIRVVFDARELAPKD